MNWKNCMFAVFALAAGASGAALPCRPGTVLAGELSTRKPAIANESRYPVKVAFQEKRYALLTLAPTPGRTFSRHDYALEAFGIQYPCVAVRRNGEGFDAAKSEILNVGTNDKIGLLFVVDGAVAGASPVTKLEFRALYAKGGYAVRTVPFQNCENREFTAPEAIPAAGMVKVDE